MPSPIDTALEQAVYQNKVQGLIGLLTAMGVSLDGIDVSFNGSQFVFKTATQEAAERLAQALTQFAQSQQLRQMQVITLSIPELIQAEIAASQGDEDVKATAEFAMNRFIQNNRLNYIVDPSQKQVEVTFPPALKKIITSLNDLSYPHMCVIGDKLVFDIQHYLRDHQEHDLVILTQADASQAPVVLLSPTIIESRTVYFSTEIINDTEAKVTPFVYMPPGKAPECRFVLDISGSMSGERLSKAIGSLWAVVNVLFKLYPDANLRMQTFNHSVSDLRTKPYTKADLNDLKQQLAQICVAGSTSLYFMATDVAEEYLKGETGHNTLIFTDGGDTDGQVATDRLNNLIGKIARDTGNPDTNTFELQTALQTNNIAVISCGVSQDSPLYQLCEAFHSEILNVDDASFTQAEGSPEFLAKFLQLSRLFKTETVITQTDIDQSQTHKAVLKVEGPGGYVAATPILCRQGSEVHFNVTDAKGDLMASGATTAVAFVEQAHSASASSISAPMLASSSSSGSPSPSPFTQSLTVIGANVPPPSKPASHTTGFTPTGPSA